MAAIVREGIDAGALGFSTSRVVNHKTANGDPVPGTYAHEDELFGIAAAMSDVPYCVFQLAQSGADGDGAGGGAQGARLDAAPLGRVRPAGVVPAAPGAGRARPVARAARRRVGGARRDGATVVPQVANRPFGMLLGLTNRHPFVMRPTFAELARRARLARRVTLVAELSKPDVRARSCPRATPSRPTTAFATIGMIAGHMPQLVFPLGDDVDYEPTADQSLAARAEAARGHARSSCSTT